MICYAFPLAHEASDLLKECTQKEQFSIGGLHCTLANFRGRPILVALVGMGQIQAAENAAAIFMYFRPKALVLAGYGGALVPQMRPLFPASTIFLDRLTIPQLVSAQARLTVFISNDTGPAHIAAAVGTPVVMIMDRPDPHSFTPAGDVNRLIFGPTINEIPVAQVYRAAHELIALSRTDNLFRAEK